MPAETRRNVATNGLRQVLASALQVWGGTSSALALIHIFWALLFLAALGLIGVFTGERLPDVSQR